MRCFNSTSIERLVGFVTCVALVAACFAARGARVELLLFVFFSRVALRSLTLCVSLQSLNRQLPMDTSGKQWFLTLTANSNGQNSLFICTSLVLLCTGWSSCLLSRYIACCQSFLISQRRRAIHRRSRTTASALSALLRCVSPLLIPTC